MKNPIQACTLPHLPAIMVPGVHLANITTFLHSTGEHSCSCLYQRSHRSSKGNKRSQCRLPTMCISPRMATTGRPLKAYDCDGIFYVCLANLKTGVLMSHTAAFLDISLSCPHRPDVSLRPTPPLPSFDSFIASRLLNVLLFESLELIEDRLYLVTCQRFCLFPT